MGKSDLRRGAHLVPRSKGLPAAEKENGIPENDFREKEVLG